MSNADLHTRETFSLLFNLMRYQNTSEEALEASKKGELVKFYQSQGKSPFAGLRHALFFKKDEIDEIKHRYETAFTIWFRYSFVIMVFTLFETRGKAFCNELKKRHNLDLSLRELNGSTVDRIECYIKKVAKLKGISIDIWQEIEFLQAVRNCIVHTNGLVAEYKRADETKLASFLKSNSSVSITEDGFLFLKKEICSDFLEITFKWFSVAFDAAGFGPPYEENPERDALAAKALENFSKTSK